MLPHGASWRRRVKRKLKKLMPSGMPRMKGMRSSLTRKKNKQQASSLIGKIAKGAAKGLYAYNKSSRNSWTFGCPSSCPILQDWASVNNIGTAYPTQTTLPPRTDACSSSRFRPCPLRFFPWCLSDWLPFQPRKGWLQPWLLACKARECSFR